MRALLPTAPSTSSDWSLLASPTTDRHEHSSPCAVTPDRSGRSFGSTSTQRDTATHLPPRSDSRHRHIGLGPSWLPVVPVPSRKLLLGQVVEPCVPCVVAVFVTHRPASGSPPVVK